MSQRFFVENPVQGDSATLVDAEAHHLTHVMRARPGLEVTLFDGTGWEFPARVEKLGRQSVELAVLDRMQVSRELALPVALAVALPKGDRQKWLVEKVTELGVARLIPLITERGVAQPVEQALARLRRGVIEASKQCGRNVLMEIATPVAWPELAEQASRGEAVRGLAHPGGMSLGEFAQQLRPAESGARDGQNLSPLLFAVGPEGGFSPAEVELAQARDWQRVGLGRCLLRVETAALTLAAWAVSRFAIK